MSTVLVTGGSGFIGGHCILQLLAAGHSVRTTVRSLQREGQVRGTLRAAGAVAEDDERLSFFAADLEKDAGWAEAAAGCDYVLHVASPFPLNTPRHDDELVVPAHEGTLRALHAARDAGVKRVVLTSSFAAIGCGHPPSKVQFDESDWSQLDGEMTAYMRSKTVAERAAWDFLAREGAALEMAVINPVAVLGPALGTNLSSSVVLVQRMLDGSLPGYPKLSFGIVDVRDVADLHLRAMTHPDAAGQRFLAVGGDFKSLLDIATVLKRNLGPQGRKVPAWEMPDWLVRGAALMIPPMRQILPELGKHKHGSNAKARRVLGWTPRSDEESILATAESLLRLGCLKSSPKKVLA